MHNYKWVIFDLYNTIIDDREGYEQREKFRLDSIYTIIEKSNYPVKFAELSEKYGEMTLAYLKYHAETKRAFIPFYQVEYLMNLLHIEDIVVFKKVYDSYVEAVLHIPPKPMKNAAKALEALKENDKKIGLVSNTGRTPGYVLRILLKELNLLKYFDCLVFSDEAGFLKPDKRIFDFAVEMLDADKNETIFIGDIKSSDYDGAINAGLNAHLFNPDIDNLYQLAMSYSA